MYYAESSVLIPFTLARTVDVDKTKAVDELFEKINSEEIKCCTSFYALLEVYIFALGNALNFEEGSSVGKEALVKILQSKMSLLTMVNREERILHENKFKKLKDKSDIPHAILASINNCKGIVTYDSHFKDVLDVIISMTPEELLEKLKKNAK